MTGHSTDCTPQTMAPEDPLFILYTSGSTGKQKGVMHTTAGYLVYVSLTHELIFDVRDEDTYWCTADIGWVTGHSYIVYGPLANGATSVMFEGVPQYPDWGRFWDVVDKYSVTILYTAPTAIRAISRAWPGMMRGVYGDPERFFKTYFTTFPGRYFTGDGCRRDEDGYYWITGRVDDVINVSGHRIGTAEVESALVSHGAVAEAAVVGFPHDIKGQGIYAYVTLKQGMAGSASLRDELIQQVRRGIGALAKPDVIHWAPSLPKTRSGKIM